MSIRAIRTADVEDCGLAGFEEVGLRPVHAWTMPAVMS